MQKKSLEIHEEMGNRAGVARQYGNLGAIYKTRGDLDAGEEMQKKSLEIHEEMGNREGMARACIGLGLVSQARGDLGRARDAYERARDLFAEVGIPGDVALLDQTLASLDDTDPADS